jgi:hypothetical protein
MSKRVSSETRFLRGAASYIQLYPTESVGVAQGMSAGDVILTAEAEYAANYVAFLQVCAPGSAPPAARGVGRLAWGAAAVRASPL